MKDLILAIDQGTTGTTVLVVDQRMTVRARGYREFAQIYPRPGEVEHDPEAIWASVTGALGDALKPEDAERLAAVGITNQRETTLLWERATGKPVGNAIVWQDRRTAPQCAELKAAGHEDFVRQRTGLVLDPYFSATKIKWLLDDIAGLRDRAEAGQIAFGTVDSFLVWRLSGGRVHATDVTNASRTLLLDLETLRFSDDLCDIFDVPTQILPEVKASAGRVAETRGVPGVPDGIPIAGIAGDQQAALFGQDCIDTGDAKCTYGTGAFLLMNVGPRPTPSQRGLLSTVAWTLGEDAGNVVGPVARKAYALEAIALQNVDLLRAMQADAGHAITNLRVDGGAAANDLLMQLQADLSGLQIFRPEMVESTALGAAKLAARGVGLPRTDRTGETARVRIFNPNLDVATREEMIARWHSVVTRA